MYTRAAMPSPSYISEASGFRDKYSRHKSVCQFILSCEVSEKYELVCLLKDGPSFKIEVKSVRKMGDL